MHDPKRRPKRWEIAALATLSLLISLVASSLTFAATARHAMVVAERELAAKAGLQILARGGNAIDAAAAASLAVGLTNPSSCGIGGGGFMLIYLARTGELYALDYRERAAALANPKLYVRDGQPIDQRTRSGPMAVAVPGEIAGLQAALERFGTMKFSEVAAPAIALGRRGFPCGDHLAKEIARTQEALARDRGLSKVFLHRDGSALKAGETIVEADLARTLEGLGNRPVQQFLPRPRSAGDRRLSQGARRIDHHCRPRRLSAGVAHSAASLVSRLRRLLDAAAVVGRYDAARDARRAGSWQ